MVPLSKILTWVQVLAILFCSICETKAQNISRIEYFIDTDPGFGNAQNVPISSSPDVTTSFLFNVTSLPSGFHQLFVRAYSAPYTVQENGRTVRKGGWSIVSRKLFYKENFSTTLPEFENINKGEYFIDHDPGFGNATNVPLAPGVDISNLTLTLNITSLPNGFHVVYTRFRNTKGIWGHSVRRIFYKQDISSVNAGLSNITGGEYFIDRDPGFGNGMNIVISPGPDLTSVPLNVDISPLNSGFHKIFTRFKDSRGRWGHSNQRLFYKDSLRADGELSDIVKLEYFIDKDPGFGSGRNIPVAAGNDIQDILLEVPLDTIPIGFHHLYIRALDRKGKWSITNSSPFTVEPPSGAFISIGTIDSAVCTGATISVPFNTNAPFNEDNVFTAQLSDNTGSFRNPVNIGQSSTRESGSIESIIPSWIQPGSNYRIRVTSSSPADTSEANIKSILINSTPPPFNISGDTVSCMATKPYFLSNATDDPSKYSWRLSGGGELTSNGKTATIDWNESGIHQLKVKYSGVCAGADSIAVLRVNIIDQPLTGRFTNLLPVDGDINLSLPVTFSWQPIAGALLYDLYIWPQDSVKPIVPTVKDINGINYTVTTSLKYQTMYQWEVVAKRDCYHLRSAVQTFRLRFLPDLVVDKINIPVSGFSGQSFTVNWETKNSGIGGTLNAQWYDRVFLSKDAILEVDTDYSLGAVHNLSELPTGASYSQTATFSLPQGIDGNFYVFIVTSAYGGLHELNTENNTSVSATTVAIQLTPPPDLQVTSIVPLNTVFSGQSVNVSWTVVNAGTGSSVSDGWTDYIYLSADTVLDFSKAMLLGSHQREGVLDVQRDYSKNISVRLPDATFGTYYLYVITDVANQVYEHAAERNNVLRSDSISVILSPPIDLRVFNISAPTTVSIYESIVVQWEVSNDGGSSTDNRSWVDAVYLCKTDTFNVDSAISIGRLSHSASLPPGNVYLGTAEVTIPGGIIGEYYLYVVADDGDDIFEYEFEGNNIFRQDATIQITSPDLIVSNVEIPESDSSGQELLIKWAVRNTGLGILRNTGITDRIWLSPFAVLDTAGSHELYRTAYNTGEMNAGDSVRNEAMIRLPEGISGNYYIYVQTDFSNAAEEALGENNNFARSSSFIRIALSPWTDLQVKALSVSDSAMAGELISLTFEVLNSGKKTFTSTRTDKVFISASPVWDSATAIYIRDFGQSLPLAADSSNKISANIRIPARLHDSTYYIYVYTDALNNVYEHNGESNNVTRSSGIAVTEYPPIDLEIFSVSGPAEGSSGKPISIQWKVLNRGKVATMETQWPDALYLSTDSQFDPNTDIFIKEFLHRGALDSGQTYIHRDNFQLPNGISGIYHLIVVADYGNFNDDINLSNNAKAVTTVDGTNLLPIDISLTPPSDLRVATFTAPDEAPAGQPITVRWTVSNYGTGNTNSNSWTDKVYLSKNSGLDNSDINIGSFSRTDSLLSGMSYSDSLQVFLPLHVTGNYYLIIKADASNNIYEHGNELNNASELLINVVQPLISDLIVSSIKVPADAIAGEDISLEWTIKNIGQFPGNGYMKEGIYLSEDSMKSAEDILISTKETDVSLPPHEEVISFFRGELTGASLKDYYVIVHTELQNNIFESNDSNNITLSRSKVKVNVPLLPMNVPLTKSLKNKQEAFYRLEIPDSLKGESFVISLDGDADDAANEIYVRFGEVPTRAVYEYSHAHPYEADQEIVIPELKAGTYYLMVRGATQSDNSQSVRLFASVLDFEIRKVEANKGGNSGTVTLVLTGSKLQSISGLALIRNNKTFDARIIKKLDPTRVFATFNLTGAELGLYNIVATDDQLQSTSLENAFEVIQSDGEILTTNVITPPNTRPSSTISLEVQYTNGGSIDLINPVLKLSSLGGAPIAFTVDGLKNNETVLSLSLAELNAPDGILRPGAGGTIIVYAKAVTTLSFDLIRKKSQ